MWESEAFSQEIREVKRKRYEEREPKCGPTINIVCTELLRLYKTQLTYGNKGNQKTRISAKCKIAQNILFPGLYLVSLLLEELWKLATAYLTTQSNLNHFVCLGREYRKLNPNDIPTLPTTRRQLPRWVFSPRLSFFLRWTLLLQTVVLWKVHKT